MYGVVHGVVKILLILAELKEVPIICNQQVADSPEGMPMAESHRQLGKNPEEIRDFLF